MWIRTKVIWLYSRMRTLSLNLVLMHSVVFCNPADKPTNQPVNQQTNGHGWENHFDTVMETSSKIVGKKMVNALVTSLKNMRWPSW